MRRCSLSGNRYTANARSLDMNRMCVSIFKLQAASDNKNLQSFHTERAQTSTLTSSPLAAHAVTLDASSHCRFVKLFCFYLRALAENTSKIMHKHDKAPTKFQRDPEVT